MAFSNNYGIVETSKDSKGTLVEMVLVTNNTEVKIKKK